MGDVFRTTDNDIDKLRARRLRRIRYDFARTSRDHDRDVARERWRERRKAFLILATSGLIAFVVLDWLSPWPVPLTLRHAAASFNCATANAVALAPSRPGEPGYWRWLDGDHDGLACELAGEGSGIRLLPATVTSPR